MIKAAFRAGTRAELRDIERRALPARGIRLRVEACGICGTDLQFDGDATPKPFGHEVAGTVIEVGKAVTEVQVGARVVLDSATPCGWCAACRNGRQELCTDIQSFFFMDSFGAAEEMIAPAISVVPRGDLPPDVACISEPLGVAIDVIRLADIRVDSNVLVMGPGPIGLMLVALARRMGARRVFCSAFPEEETRCAVARNFGADALWDARNLADAHREAGCAIDRILVTTPPPTLASAFDIACKGGIVTFIGIGHGEHASTSFDANAFHFKKLQLRASFASPAQFTPLALDYLREGVIDGEALISHRFPLAQIEQAMATAHDRCHAVKVMIMP